MTCNRFFRVVMLALAVTAAATAALVLPLMEWAEIFLSWVRGFGAAGAGVYALVYVVGTVLLFPGTALTVGAGLLYGTIVGILIVSPASVAGATAAFLIARYFARGWVESKISKYPAFTAIDRAIQNNGFKVVLLMRLEPVFIPFALLNYGLGLTQVKLRDYVLASWIGMLPATILYVYLGTALHSVSDLMQGRLPNAGVAGTILFWGGLVALALLILLLGRIARKALAQSGSEPAEKGAA
jgi:uncharacterized membrane protein YdjX (TVP38/TMEM64 family)